MKEQIKNFKGKLDDNISKALVEHERKIGEVSIKLEIIEEIVEHIANEQQVILKEVVHDLISSLYSGLQGLYRNAYISLRSAIELTLAYIYFVDHNYDYFFWKQDKYDVKWSVLESEDVGVLSRKYLSIFSDDEFDILFSYCNDIYKNCSQFVHGKYEYMHTIKHQSVNYDKSTFNNYMDMFCRLANVIISLLLIRHGSTHLNIAETYKDTIEEILKELQLTNTLRLTKESWQ